MSTGSQSRPFWIMKERMAVRETDVTVGGGRVLHA